MQMALSSYVVVGVVNRDWLTLRNALLGLAFSIPHTTLHCDIVQVGQLQLHLQWNANLHHSLEISVDRADVDH